MQQLTASAERPPHRRDPQNFTEGDKLAWRIVAYCGAGITVVGTAAAIVAVVVHGNA